MNQVSNHKSSQQALPNLLSSTGALRLAPAVNTTFGEVPDLEKPQHSCHAMVSWFTITTNYHSTSLMLYPITPVVKNTGLVWEPVGRDRIGHGLLGYTIYPTHDISSRPTGKFRLPCAQHAERHKCRKFPYQGTQVAQL